MKQKLAYSVDNDNPAERKRFIRGTFDAISPTYDLLNRILSFGIDMRWRRFSV
ncbi:MAG TPA: class I SAM-dependent methyltransferase, partial [Spirochaetota bacterium]|nr:class I SAM-dependent methyltransferase [Spirochaetota bacterium]